MTEPSDLDLVRELGSGDAGRKRAAFTVLFERHHKRALDLAYRVLGDSALAADAAQEAFLRVYHRAGRFEARARFTSWLYRVVLNQCIDLKRKERRHRVLSLGPRVERDGSLSQGRGERGGVPEVPGPESAQPEPQAIADERAEAVRQAITRLSPKLSEVVVLRYPQGMSYEEIGEVLDLPPGTVKSRLNRAHAALREILGPVLDDPSSEVA